MLFVPAGWIRDREHIAADDQVDSPVPPGHLRAGYAESISGSIGVGVAIELADGNHLVVPVFDLDRWSAIARIQQYSQLPVRVGNRFPQYPVAGHIRIPGHRFWRRGRLGNGGVRLVLVYLFVIVFIATAGEEEGQAERN